jgi:flagellar biosynthetic protein FlhB
MAEDNGQDKTEDPTGKRLTDSRKKGQIARSKELSTFAMLVSGATMLMMTGNKIGKGLLEIMREQFSISRAEIFDPAVPVQHLVKVISNGIVLIIPFLAVMVIVALISPIAMGGWNFSWEAMQPKFEKLDPIKGIPRLFALKGFIELIKAILKFSLIVVGVVVLFNLVFEDYVSLSSKTVENGIFQAMHLIGAGFLFLSALLVIIAIFDVPYQLWDHNKQLKMTKQEVKDENKDTEGNPEIKGKIRQLQMEAAQRRMMEEVPKADVIVTNPTHFAVALKYNPNSTAAPKLVAKGTDVVASHIRTIAASAKVPLIEAPPLARALYYSTELNEQIPQGLFLAVAQVLAYVFQLKTALENGWDEPEFPSSIVVPDEFKTE